MKEINQELEEKDDRIKDSRTKMDGRTAERGVAELWMDRDEWLS